MRLPARNGLKTALWVYIFIYSLALIVFQSYAPSANHFLYTYELEPVGMLKTTFGSFHFVISASFVLLWLVPLTLGFFLSNTRQMWRNWVHVALVCILTLWLLAVFIFGCIDWRNANGTDASNFFNPANDWRWCCVHYMLDGAPCANNIPCPGVSVGDLKTRGTFLWQLWWGFVFFAILALDLILSFCLVVPTFREEDEEQEEQDQQPQNAFTEVLIQSSASNRIRGKKRLPEYRAK